MMRTRLIAGAMSGTSADGIDVAIVAIDGRATEMSATLVRHAHQPYDAELRRAIFALRGSGQVALRELARCGRDVSLAYADAVRNTLVAANLAASDLAAIAAHGQTLFHDPPNTIQWIDPALLATEVGCPVVSDFRRADCAAGGQGAPLVPFGDYILFHHSARDRAVVNIGGIANITFLPAGAPLEKTLAFDIGPGNCISDHLMREHDPNGPGVDVGGQLASHGKIMRELFDAFVDHPYFKLTGPKSTDGPQMIDIFLKARQRVGASIPLQDQLATACALTAELIQSSLRALGARPPVDLIVAGGGTQNQTLMRRLDGARTSEQFGIPTDAREAIAFALLGAATLDNVPANVPSCTGAARLVVLGAITPRP
jgi:anhydro-N-acetylmuramic acid kinase